MTSGLVSIVGAGPGAPDLLTVRAVRCLRRADVVIHDGLVPAAIVRLARSARRQLVSRRPGADGLAPSDVVALMIEAAARGHRVVRLRAGDVFVLGRGAEEAMGLVHAGVPFEIVPGLTTASAAPTLAGIPLTHRGVASGFIVVSGHAPEAYEHLLHAVPIRTMTLIVLMGIRARARVAGFLLDRGWPSDTPAAIVSNASRRDQRVWRGTLRALSRHRTTAPRPAPGVIVIGDVAEIGTTIATAIRVRRPNGRLHEVTSTSPFQEVPWQR